MTPTAECPPMSNATPHLAHIVFFDLTDDSPAAIQKLVDSANKNLSGHEGTVYFSVGVIGKEFNRPVNDQAYSVALHVVFDSKASHDKYQVHPRHTAFIEECKPNWKRVRVFDSYVG